MAEVPASADVIIIGAGPAGAAAAWALERAQPGLRVVLIERGPQAGSGASNASLENFRTAWAAPCLNRLMQRSFDVFTHADEYFVEGTHLGVQQRGYLWCAFTEAQVDELRREVAHLQSVGLVHVQFLDTGEVQSRFGWLGPRLIAGKFDPRAGWLDSHALVQAFLRASPSTTLLLDQAETRLLRRNDMVYGVALPSGEIHAPAVLIAAGAESGRVAATAGLSLPLVLRPCQSFTTGWRHREFAPDAPAVIGAAPFPHVRPEAQDGAIFGWEYRWNAKGLGHDGRAAKEFSEPGTPADRWRDPRMPSAALMLLARQFGHAPGAGFGDPRYLRGLSHRAGYYVYRDSSTAWRTTSDGRRVGYDSQRAILDAHPDVSGLFVSVAHVGHGIMSAPAAGEIIAARMLGRPLPDPTFADFGWHAHDVEHDSGGLTKDVES